ncbi:9104_t:CDS:2, partial [Gigaspora margarita]
STASFDSFTEEELYENPWKDLINEKNPAIYLTGVMTAEIKKDSITPNMNLPTEQEAFKAAMQKHTTIPK